MRVTIPLTNGTTHTAECGEDRWVELPKGTNPDEPAWSECEAQYKPHASRSASAYDAATLRCDDWYWNEDDARFRIRPTNGRSWSDIGLADEQLPRAQRDYANPVTVEGPISVKLWREGSTAKMQVLAMPEHLRRKHEPDNPIATLDDMILGSLHEPALAGRYVWLCGAKAKHDRSIAGLACLADSDANSYLSRVESLIRHANTLPLVKGEEPTEAPSAPQSDPRIAALEAENAALRWLANAHRIEFISVNGCLITNASRAKAQAEAADIPHFLAARDLMERKP